jgi:hypothetical protein
MQPVRLITALLFAVAIGTLTLLAAPAWAASPTPPVAVHVSPNPVVAGHTVTLSGSVGPEAAGSECATGVSLLSRAFDSNQEFADVPALGAAVRPDGTFTTTTIIPRSRAAGTYPITGRCGGGNFGGTTLEVRTVPTTPTTTPGPMAPTPPDPPVTQPQPPAPMVAGPATQPTSQLASRWVIPGLAALGSGTLAALGVWLLYRRRNPAHPSRHGRCHLAH